MKCKGMIFLNCDTCHYQFKWQDHTKVCGLWGSLYNWNVKCTEIGNKCGGWKLKEKK